MLAQIFVASTNIAGAEDIIHTRPPKGQEKRDKVLKKNSKAMDFTDCTDFYFKKSGLGNQDC